MPKVQVGITMKAVLIIFGIVLIAIAVYSFTPSNYSDKDKFLDMYFNPEKYPLLPDDLTPYVCDNGKVDLDTAAELVAKGLSRSAKYSPPKDSLRCN